MQGWILTMVPLRAVAPRPLPRTRGGGEGAPRATGGGGVGVVFGYLGQDEGPKGARDGGQALCDGRAAAAGVGNGIALRARAA